MAKENSFQQIKTFTEVCSKIGKSETEFAVDENLTAKEKAAIYKKRLRLIAEALNPAGWKAKTSDTSQRKYYPWFWVHADESRPSGFRLSYYVYVCDDVFSDLGARPRYASSDIAIYAGNQFLAEYEAWANYEELSENE